VKVFDTQWARAVAEAVVAGGGELVDFRRGTVRFRDPLTGTILSLSASAVTPERIAREIFDARDEDEEHLRAA
jgi:hypothetical protein